jgi:hypothetical protein
MFNGQMTPKEFNMTTTEYSDITQSFVRSGRTDSKGREIGYIVALVDNGTDFRALVQNARRINGEWVEFGVKQRSKSFASQATATGWAYATAHARIASIKGA